MKYYEIIQSASKNRGRCDTLLAVVKPGLWCEEMLDPVCILLGEGTGQWFSECAPITCTLPGGSAALSPQRLLPLCKHRASAAGCGAVGNSMGWERPSAVGRDLPRSGWSCQVSPCCGGRHEKGLQVSLNFLLLISMCCEFSDISLFYWLVVFCHGGEKRLDMILLLHLLSLFCALFGILGERSLCMCEECLLLRLDRMFSVCIWIPCGLKCCSRCFLIFLWVISHCWGGYWLTAPALVAMSPPSGPLRLFYFTQICALILGTSIFPSALSSWWVDPLSLYNVLLCLFLVSDLKFILLTGV